MQTSISCEPVRFGVLRLAVGQVDLWCWLAWTMTALRLPLLVGCIAVMMQSPFSPAVSLLVFLIVLFDVLDGEVFQLSHKASSPRSIALRHIVDAVGDRVVMYPILALGVVVYSMPFPVYLAIVLREILLTLIVLRPLIGQHVIISANTWSKLGTLCIALIGVNYSLPLLPETVLLGIFVGLSVVGLFRYAYRSDEQCRF